MQTASIALALVSCLVCLTGLATTRIVEHVTMDRVCCPTVRHGWTFGLGADWVGVTRWVDTPTRPAAEAALRSRVRGRQLGWDVYPMDSMSGVECWESFTRDLSLFKAFHNDDPREEFTRAGRSFGLPTLLLPLTVALPIALIGYKQWRPRDRPRRGFDVVG